MSDAYRIVIKETGGPEVMAVEPIKPPAPAAGEVLIRHEAVGLNFIDTYHRSGLYPLALPSGLGTEAAGRVEAVGEGVEGLHEGDLVGYFSGPVGAYASHRSVAADRTVRLPDGIDAETAAAAMLKGCTAEYLIERCGRIEKGETILVHAAAGGVGQIVVQWLKAIGATVIAHAGNRDKVKRAEALGADHALCCPFDELAAEVRSLTEARGVDVVLDGVGAASWAASVAAVARRGLIVSYGNASGAVPPINLRELVAAGSVFLTRPTLFDYVATRDELEKSAERMFEMIRSGAVKIEIGARLPLKDAAEAHRMLEARKTVGSTLLVP